jgi:hypothetical protein
LSRAAFARQVGVTPHTVYRWELPDTAAEARRPRGAELLRLRSMLNGAVTAETRGESAGRNERGPNEADLGRAPESTPSAWADEDLARVLPSLERVLRGDSRKGHGELLALLTRGRALSTNARALACYGVTLFELLQRSDAKSALLAIAPALADAEAGRLEANVAAKVFAVVALAHAEPDGVLFDVGRVHGYAARVDAIGQGDDEASSVAWIASMSAAVLIGDRDLLERGFARLDEANWPSLPQLLKLHVEEFRMKAMLAGRTGVSCRHYDAIAERAEQLGYSLLQARALSHLARSELDRLAAPESVLALARRAKLVGNANRAAPGLHQVLAVRAEAEALLRMGRTTEAFSALSELDHWSRETGMVPLYAISVKTRLLQLAGRRDDLMLLANELNDCTIPSLRPICRAYASYVEAVALLSSSEDTAATIAAFERAEAQSGGWPFLLRDILLHMVTAHVVTGDHGAARLVLRRAQRFVDQFPSAWVTAFLRRLEGGVLTAAGSWDEGRRLIESAIATFELAGDACDAALTRYVLMTLARANEDPEAVEGQEKARAELQQLGLEPSRALDVAVARVTALARERGTPPERPRAGIERLVVPLQRLSVRGAAPALVLRELFSVVRGLLPGRVVRIEELDSAGVARLVVGEELSPADIEWIEFGDGAGRVLRLGIAGHLADDERQMLVILTTTASLALETATLRSFGEINTTGAPDVELPGFVAAAPATRALRAELVRLSGSRSTVIITGESGVGKELVARAIHDLSDRKGRPYVAFNCAAVPRDLFEGQLFGYKRGAFTGAVSDHPGVIRTANGGTLFLDEIGELPLDIQPKLLRFLENSEIFPLGERRSIQVDVRIVAATHRDLGTLVHEGKFREDLYYRLQVVPIFVPPLRERREDIPVLARHFVNELSRRGEESVLAPDAIAALSAHPWPGNVRELRNAIERALAFSPAPAVLRAEHLRLDALTATRRAS